MLSISLLLTDYGLSRASNSVFEFTKRHRDQLLEVVRVDSFDQNGDDEQILGNHIFYFIFSESKSLCRFFVLGCGATSGYSGSGPGDFEALMNWIRINDIEISYHSTHNFDDYLKLWGTEIDAYGQNIPSESGKHRKYGPSPWDYGDDFIQYSNCLSLEEYNNLQWNSVDTRQKLYSNTCEFLLEILNSGAILRFL